MQPNLRIEGLKLQAHIEPDWAIRELEERVADMQELIKRSPSYNATVVLTVRVKIDNTIAAIFGTHSPTYQLRTYSNFPDKSMLTTQVSTSEKQAQFECNLQSAYTKLVKLLDDTRTSVH